NSTYDNATDDEHGTHTTGTVGAAGGNALGVVGVNWQVTMISAKFLGASGGAKGQPPLAGGSLPRPEDAAPRETVASQQPWGGGGNSDALHAAINRMAKAGILFIASAGNTTDNNDINPHYPGSYSTLVAAGSEPAASYEAIIAVASIDNDGAISSFSSYG